MKNRILSLSMVLALVAVLVVPMAALAAGDTASGTLNATNLTPDVTAVEVYNEVGCTTTAASVTPQTTYYAKVTVSDPNTLADLVTVKVTFKHFAAGVATAVETGTVDTRTLVRLTCTVGTTPVWAVDPIFAAGTATWAIVTGSCSQPALTGTSGDWIFAFTPGKVATEAAGGVVANAGWGVYAKATDVGPLSDEMWWVSGTDVKKGMYWYGELAIDQATVAFGNIAPGAIDLASPNFVLTNIANGVYQIQLKSSATWTCVSPVATLTLVASQTPAAAQLALEADDDATTIDAQLMTGDYVVYTGHATDSGPTIEAGATVSINTLWLSLGATGIPVGTYTGTLYYQVLND